MAWSEAFNVISGASLRATYMKVPSGKYTFRAVAVANTPEARTTQLAFPFIIRQPYWNQAWFLSLLVAAFFTKWLVDVTDSQEFSGGGAPMCHPLPDLPRALRPGAMPE